MLATRMAFSRSTAFAFLFFNLVLAWIPLGLSLLLREVESGKGWGRAIVLTAGMLWVSFFPNSFYIVTDLVHMDYWYVGVPRWFDLMMTVGFGFLGVFLGILSLYLLHISIQERLGQVAGWAFAIVMLGLGSFGVYAGRFLRWNSWWVLTHPDRLLTQTGWLLQNPRGVVAFSLTFFAFSLMAYFFVVAMARVHEGER